MRRLVSVYRDAYSGLPPRVWLLATAMFVNRAGTMVAAFLTLYLTGRLGLSALEAAPLVTLFGVGSLAGAYAGGWATDRFGPRVVQGTSLAVTGVGFLVLAELHTPAGIGAALCVVGAAGNAFRPALSASLVAHCPADKLTRGFALLRLAINLGQVGGPALGGLLAAVSYRWLFVADGASCLLTAALLLWWTRGWHTRAEEPAVAHGSAASPWRDSRFLGAMLCATPVAFVFMQFLHTLPLYWRDSYGLDEQSIGLLLAANPTLIVAVEMVLVHRLQHRRTLSIVASGVAVLGAGFALWPLGSGFAFALAVVLVCTVGEMLESPFLGSYVAHRAPAAARGRYMAVYTLPFSTALIAAPAAGLPLYQTLGPTALWLLCAGLCAAAAIGYAVLARAAEVNR